MTSETLPTKAGRPAHDLRSARSLPAKLAVQNGVSCSGKSAIAAKGRRLLAEFRSVLLIALGLGAAAAAADPPDYVFPLIHSADRRYLVDQNGMPFPILGRTAWAITSLDADDYKFFIADSLARGHDAIEAWIGHDPRANHSPFDGEGNKPFLKRIDGEDWNGTLTYRDIAEESPDFTTPNEAYWLSVDKLLDYCQEKDVLVFFFPAYVGYHFHLKDGLPDTKGGAGWMPEMVANGPSRMAVYGAWIAQRFKDRKNLVWMMGGDFGTEGGLFTQSETAVEEGLFRGLKSVPGQSSTLMSAEWNSGSIATDQAVFGDAMTLNGVYSWTGDIASLGRRAYAHTPAVPAYLLEEPYDEEGGDGNRVNPSAIQPVRRFQWWGWLTTIGGYMSGNGYVWRFTGNRWWTPGDESWKAHLDTQGARDMARLNEFVRSVPWYKLVPSGLAGMRDLIVTGGSSPELPNYVAAAAAPDGTLLVAYIPPAHAGGIGVDMEAVRAPFDAQWFDPSSGSRIPAQSRPMDGSKLRLFSPPGLNSVGDRDWVLTISSAK